MKIPNHLKNFLFVIQIIKNFVKDNLKVNIIVSFRFNFIFYIFKSYEELKQNILYPVLLYIEEACHALRNI
jgi:hypothetical protein